MSGGSYKNNDLIFYSEFGVRLGDEQFDLNSNGDVVSIRG